MKSTGSAKELLVIDDGKQICYGDTKEMLTIKEGRSCKTYRV